MQADRFCFGPKILGQSKAIWFGLLIIRTKAKHFDLVQKCSYRKQIVSVWPKNSGTKQSNLIWSENCLGQNRTFLYNPKTYTSKAKHFDLVQKCSYRKQIVSVWPKNSGSKQSNLIWSGNCLGQNRTFLYNPKTYRSKQNVLIWSTYYRNESKMFWFGPLIVGTKAKQFAFARVPLTMLLIYLKFGKSALN